MGKCINDALHGRRFRIRTIKDHLELPQALDVQDFGTSHEYGLEELLLAPEVIVHQSNVDRRGAGDIANGDRMKSLGGKQELGSVEYSLAREY